MIWLVLLALLAWWALGPWVLVGCLLLLLVPRVRRRLRPERPWRVVGIGTAVVAVLAGLVVVIPDGWLPIPQSPGLLASPGYVGRPFTPQPITVDEVPRHPHMARNGASSMHNDAWATDAYAWPGPLGHQPEVDTAWYGIEECATLAFDTQDRIVALCGDLEGPLLHVIDPETMRPLATKDLPDRPDSDAAPWADLCGGSYFYLDERDRAVLATTDRRILAVRTADAEGAPDLTVDESWDLGDAVGDGDCLIALMPDWDGRIWFETSAGVVGTVDPASGRVRTLDLGEEIANSFAVDEAGGVYVVSVRAFYRLTADDTGRPVVDWRSAYDRGTRQKPSMLSQGSGSTPTLIDDGVVVITDNAEPRINAVFFDRDTGEEICKAPIFEADASATENSLVSVGSGVVVENNHGYGSPVETLFGRASEPGVARVDLAGRECRVAWTSDVIAPSSVPKASLATGLVYVYSKRPSWSGVSSWYLTAIDAQTGRTAFSVRTGTGVLMNNHYAAMTLAPDGSAYIATLAGMVRIRDRRDD